MSEQSRGFDDGTNYLLDPGSEAESFKNNYKPPPKTPGCAGCIGTVVVDNDCPACQYELGFTEGASK